MKTTFVLCVLALAVLVFGSSCEDVEHDHHRRHGDVGGTTTTTTEETTTTTMRRPIGSTVETQTTRSY